MATGLRIWDPEMTGKPELSRVAGMWIEDEIKSLRTKAKRLEYRATERSAEAQKVGKVYQNFAGLMEMRAAYDRLEAKMYRADADRLERGERWGKYVTFQALDEFMARPPVQPKDLNRGLDPLDGLPVPFLLAAFCVFWAGGIVWMVAG